MKNVYAKALSRLCPCLSGTADLSINCQRISSSALRTSPISSCLPSTWLSWVAVEGPTRPTYPRPSRSLFSACPSNNCTHRWAGTYLSHVMLPGKMGSLLSKQVRRKLCIHYTHYTVTACGILTRSSLSRFPRGQARGWELCSSCSTAIPLSSTK